jgi:hypothetical protein
MKTTAILTSKNDNYGGNLHHRAIMCLTSLIENHDEVIFVDWRTKDNNSIINNIKYKLPHTKKLKSIQVSKEFLQEKYPSISRYSMIESIGRNVGIRRADGDYIISTNIDIISSPINHSILNEDIFYTVPRRDIDENFHLGLNSFSKLYETIWNNRDSYQQKNKIMGNSDVWSLINCCGDYQIGHRNVWEKMRGFEESILFGCGIDTNVMKKASFFSQIKTLDEHYVFHLNHGKSSDKDEDEELAPMSNQESIIQKFTNTENNDNWGMSNENLPIEII